MTGRSWRLSSSEGQPAGAHNNLGVIHLERGDLYSAASKFEWARKLLPGHQDPRLNLAQAITRLALKWDTEGLSRDELQENLETIALRGDSKEWRTWAAERLAAVP